MKKKKTTIDNSALSESILGYNPGSLGTQLSQVDTLFRNNRWSLISNMRQLLSEMYVEHGLVQTVVDVPVDDGLRGGVEIKSKQLSPENVEELMAWMERENDVGIIGQTAKWNRLFGGAGTLILTDQDPRIPFKVSSIKEGDSVEFRALDMWELFWSMQNTSDYSAAIDGNYLRGVEEFDYYGERVNKSRVLTMRGVEAPSFVRPRLRGWGLSIMEQLVRSINQYLKANDLTFEVLDEFKIDVYKMDGLVNTLLNANGKQQVQNRIQVANQQKNYQKAVVLDGKDDFIQKELSFTGIAETMVGIRMQIASDLRMPLTKVFGISAAGFSSGEDDIENYNSMVESQIRQKIKYHIITLIEVRCQQLFGYVPEDLKIEFKPLRILSAEQEENVKTQQYTRILGARTAGLITQQEFRDMVNKANLFPVQVDPDVELDIQEETGGLEETESGESGKAPESTVQADEPKPAKNALGRSVVAVVGVRHGEDILVGRRRDSNKWVFPGGHAGPEDNSIRDTARRELNEESGINFEGNMKWLKAAPNAKKFVVCYEAQLDNRIMPRTTLDPDNEIGEWKWVKHHPETKELHRDNRHHKPDHLIEHYFPEVKV